MLMLIFHIDDDLYTIESSSVVEIIPRVPLRKIHHVPQYVAGLFNYRGEIVPVIDLCHLLRDTLSRNYLSTRIIMVKDNYHQQHLGLIAERITETLNVRETDFVNSGIKVKEAAYLGGILMNKKGIIQRIDLRELFDYAADTYLLTSGENNIHELTGN